MWSREKLERVLIKVFKCFHENSIQANQDKCHFISRFWIITILSLTDCSVENSSSEILVGLLIDWKLNFNEHVTNLCNKASKKIQASSRNFWYTPVTQGKLLLNVSFLSAKSNYVGKAETAFNTILSNHRKDLMQNLSLPVCISENLGTHSIFMQNSH